MRNVFRQFTLLFIGLGLGISISLIAQESTKDEHYNFPLFVDVIDSVETYYLDDIPKERLIQAAINGIFAELDTYSKFLTSKQTTEQQNYTAGQYQGFGFEVRNQPEHVEVTKIFKSSPAEKAGLIVGDQILSVNQQSIDHANYGDLMIQIRNAAKQKQPIVIGVLRNKQAQAEMTLLPATIAIESMQSQLLADGLGYIEISGFQEQTFEQLHNQLKEWRSQTLNGLIIDLRDNSGGLFQQAILSADLFLNRGTIISTTGRFDAANKHYKASPQTALPDIPILVLISNKTASAAEVLAAALQQNQRALLLGESSFGKNSIQSFIPTISQQANIKLTVAHYLTPNGDNIHQTGLTPDIKSESNTGNKNQNPHIINDENLPSQDHLLTQAINWFKEHG